MLSTPTRPTRRSLQAGQAIVLIALLILVLFGMLGLAVDSGRGYVDRRDQQTAVDAAALAAGDQYDNFGDPITQHTIPGSLDVYERDLRIYGGASLASSGSTPIGQLTKYTYNYTFPGTAYTLEIDATNTLFNGYQFTFTSAHDLPLAFIQIFGGSPTISIGATATSIVGNQRQTPALLTLASTACASQIKGAAASLTILGDAYTNGTACFDSNLHLAGNCYGQAGSQCNLATYYCYNAQTPPYPPPCNGGDLIGNPVVPAPTLPDPGYTALSQQYYNAAGSTFNRGTYTEMTPGTYNNWSVSSGGCYFMDAGVYTWNGGYSSHGALTSNELKSPNEEVWNQPGTTNTAQSVNNNDFWAGQGCAGQFNISVVPAGAGNGIKHQGGGNWGIEVVSVRYDRFIDPTFTTGNPCSSLAGCRRQSAPSACSVASTVDTNNSGINVNVTQNAPGAQYYDVYIDPNGCDAVRNNFSYLGTFLAPGWTDGGAPPAAAAAGPWSGTLSNARNTTGGAYWGCPAAGVTICNIDYNNFGPGIACNLWVRDKGCRAPADEVAPQCFATCPAPAGVPQDNNAMALEYPPSNGGDVANENYCQQTPAVGFGSAGAPCGAAKITPGAVQFWLPGGSCMDQNGNGSTHVFSGEQYNWIVIYEPPTTPATSCQQTNQKLNGSSLTQYIGTIYSPTASWDILGSNTAPLAGQVICYTALVTGATNAGIDFNPNYSPAPPAARLIN